MIGLTRAEATAYEIVLKGIKVTLGELKRGEIYIDKATLAAVTTGLLLGNMLSLPIYRNSALADDKYTYYSDAITPVLLASN